LPKTQLSSQAFSFKGEERGGEERGWERREEKRREGRVLFHIQLPTNSFRFTSINLLSTWMEWFSNGWWCIGWGGGVYWVT